MTNELQERAPMTMETHSLLTLLRLKGMLARAISLRGVEPNSKEMLLLEAEDISMRSLAEVLYDLGYTFEIGLIGAQRETPDADT